MGEKKERVAWEHLDVIRTIGRDRGWSRQKMKSIRGQVLGMETFEEREAYLRKLIRRR